MLACGERGEVLNKLGEQYDEKLTAFGVGSDGRMVEVLVGPVGTWTLLSTSPQGITCILGSGDGWRQLKVAANAERVRDLAEDLHRRLATFVGHLGKVGRQLTASVESYNRAVGSLERQVLPGARKFAGLGIQETRDIERLEPLETRSRVPDVHPEDAVGATPSEPVEE